MVSTSLTITPLAQGGEMWLFLLLMVGVFYFLLWRPQQKRERERQMMISRLKPKDNVVTAGGIMGKIVNVKDDEVTLQIDARKDVQIKIARQMIAHVRSSEGEAPAETSSDESKE
jgi:preprotein translocase subunit YajC